MTDAPRGELNRLFQLNRRVFKAYLLKESLERLWNHRDEGAMPNYLQKWMDQRKLQRLVPFEKLAETLLKHPARHSELMSDQGSLRVVEAVNGNIRMLINRGRGYKNLRYMLLQAKRMAVTTSNSLPFKGSRKLPKNDPRSYYRSSIFFK